MRSCPAPVRSPGLASLRQPDADGDTAIDRLIEDY